MHIHQSTKDAAPRCHARGLGRSAGCTSGRRLQLVHQVALKEDDDDIDQEVDRSVALKAAAASVFERDGPC